MTALSDAARGFLEKYEEGFADLDAAAGAARTYVVELLGRHDFDIHVIQARAKDVESARAKILWKGYSNPAEKLTDQIGLRVITRYSDEVDPIATVLRENLTIDRKNSQDKRLELGDAKFGYRSVHLVAKLRRQAFRDSRFAVLRERWMEVQVRSLLEHAWAEIQHQVVYKSGILFSEDYKRRFSAVAGALEIVEQEFLRLRAERDELIDSYVQLYSEGKGKTAQLDAARLVAMLEVLAPEGKGWRKAERLGEGGNAGAPRTGLLALRSVKIVTGKQLEGLLQRRSFRTVLETYASNEGISPLEASHLALTVLLTGHQDITSMVDFFPDLAANPAMKATFGLE